MRIWTEFKAFAVKGNMIDLAVGVLVGAAFGKVVDALVKDVLSPPLGFLTSGVNLAQLTWVLSPATESADGTMTDPGVVISYGHFLQALLDFAIVAAAIFALVRGVNALRSRAEDESDPEVPTPRDIQLLAEIRDALRARSDASP